MARRYLVTGGFGFLGAQLVRRLLQAGHQVRVLDNNSRGSASRLQEARTHVEIVTADVRDPEAIRRALHGMDAVCHLAYVNGTALFYREPAHVLEVGLKGMINVVDGCIREGIPELVLASSSEVYQNAPSIPTDERASLSIPDVFNPRYSYAGGKIVCELMAINYGRRYFQRVLIFRPHNVFGPDMGREHVIPQFITRMRRLIDAHDTDCVPFVIQGTGEESRAFVYIDDFITGLMLVIEKGAHLNIYNIGSTEEVKIADLAHRIAHHLGIQIVIVTGEPAQGSPARRCPDITKLNMLGYHPRFSLDDGLRPTIAWYASHDPPTLRPETPWE